MDATRTTVTRLNAADVCDVCHQRATIVFRVDFTDDTYSRRCTRHVASVYDRADRREPFGVSLLPDVIGQA